MISGGEVFDGDRGASRARELGKHRAKIVEGAIKGNVFQFESGFPTDGPEFRLRGLNGSATDVEILF